MDWEKEEIMAKTFYFEGGIKSEGHTPIYKMHKYFARRPHNVFRALIEKYSSPGGLVVDCFGGGGVTLIEGLTCNRRVISYDVNPIASFVQYSQTLEVTQGSIRDIADRIQKRIRQVFGLYYQTVCRHCNSDAHVRWFEHAYKVNCPDCKKDTLLSTENKKIGASGKTVDGVYSCSHCSSFIRAANVKRIGSKMLNLRYRCASCSVHETVVPLESDNQKFEELTATETDWIRRYDLFVPEDKIPMFWDRQKEDCLSKKGFEHFKDLFTPRNRLCSALYFSELDRLRDECTESEWNFLLLNISALLRYTNNMTFSVNGWMDGRPVAWAKHAFWTPNQFIECNPIEYFENRMKAAHSGIKDRLSRFNGTKASLSEEEVLNKKATHAICNRSSTSMRLPNESVDVVITDPPYGSNVQYGELCHFWLVWLRNRLPFEVKPFDLSEEVVVHRRPDSGVGYSKSFEDYRKGSEEVFKECYRVLKDNGILAFTFNNNNPDAWFAIFKAAIDAGFDLDADGITYQEQIDAYRDTAHLRFDGTAQGDFVYSFIKRVNKGIASTKAKLSNRSNKYLQLSIDVLANEEGLCIGSELSIASYRKILVSLVPLIRAGAGKEEIVDWLNSCKMVEEANRKKSNCDFDLQSLTGIRSNAIQDVLI